MYVLPSASRTRAPSPQTMNRGVPPTALNARTGELTPPGMTRCARANSSSERVIESRSGDPAGEVLGVVGQDDLGAGAGDAGERLLDDPLLVDPSPLGGGLDHRVFARHVVGRHRPVTGLAHGADHVEVGEGRLH